MIALVSAATDARTLAGETIPAMAADLCIRMLSSGQPHRALPATGAVCTAVAMGLAGTVAHRLARPQANAPRRLAMPLSVMTVDATLGLRDGAPFAESGTLYRTARPLFEGSCISKPKVARR